VYVCLCNGLTDRQVQQAVAAGAAAVKEIYAACACRAQCGRCAKTLRELMRNHACCGGATAPAAAALAPVR